MPEEVDLKGKITIKETFCKHSRITPQGSHNNSKFVLITELQMEKEKIERRINNPIHSPRGSSNIPSRELIDQTDRRTNPDVQDLSNTIHSFSLINAHGSLD